MIFQRAKDVPSTPKIAKIALPVGDSRSSTPRNMPPPSSLPPIMITNETPASGRPALRKRGFSTGAEAPSLNGYLSEPGGGSSPTNLRRNARVVVVPLKTEDGGPKPVRRRSGDSGGAPSSRRTSRVIPQNSVPFLPPATREESRTTSNSREPQAPVIPPVIPVIVTPRPRRPSVADITPRPRRPSLVDESPPSVTRAPPPTPAPAPFSPQVGLMKKYEGVALNETPRKRTFSLSQIQVLTIPDIHWRLLPYDTVRSKQCQHFNIALPPDSMITSCRPTCRTVSLKDMSKPAASEKLQNMVIVCCDLPWKIFVDRPEGITCFDVFQAIHEAFDVPLTEKDCVRFQHKLQQCKKAFKLRCKMVPRLTAVEEQMGMKRVDLLNCKTYFHGLIKPTAEDPWVMVLGPTPPCGGISK